MKNWLKEFRAGLRKVVLDIIWSAWSRVGVMGHTGAADNRIVDPEPLLLLSWECARQDPRVFDEILDWLLRNGRWINVGRLNTLLEGDRVCSPTVAGAVANFMMRQDRTPKWRKLAERYTPPAPRTMQALFEHLGKPLDPVGQLDPDFAGYGWARSPVTLRGHSQTVPVWTPASLILKCRAFFGVSIRADVFAWLVAHGSGTASNLARELGYSQRRVQDALVEMQFAETFQIRSEGNRKEYLLQANKGWQFLFESTTERAVWFNWRAFGRATSIVWKKAFEMDDRDLTEYVFESEIKKALEEARADFAASGVALSARAGTHELLQRLGKMVGSRHESK